MKRGLIYILSVILAAGFIFCAKAPEKERETAQQAIAEAQNEGAQKWAADSYQAALENWQKAEGYLNEKNYKKAKQEYMESAKLALEARDKAIAAREGAKRLKEKQLQKEKSQINEKEVVPAEEETKTPPRQKVSPMISEYVVKEGDYLWKIAGYPEVYGDPKLFGRLFYANRDKIKNCNKIRPGMVLKIPRK